MCNYTEWLYFSVLVIFFSILLHPLLRYSSLYEIFRGSKFEKLAHVRRSVYRVAPEVRQLKHNGGRMWLLETTRISLLIS